MYSLFTVVVVVVDVGVSLSLSLSMLSLIITRDLHFRNLHTEISLRQSSARSEHFEIFDYVLTISSPHPLIITGDLYLCLHTEISLPANFQLDISSGSIVSRL